MTDLPRRSPLTMAVLAVVGHSADAGEVELRLAAEGAQLGAEVAESILAELAGLGLVRVSHGSGSHRRYVLTSLGQQAVDESVAAGGAERAAELERLRTDVLSTIAHEMRTPLTAVRTSASLLLDPASEPTDEQRRTLLEAIVRNAERMQRVVEDILDLARFRAGSVRLQLRRFDPVELAREAAASLAPLAESQGTAIVIEPIAQPEAVYGDRRRLEQALVNLVSNAVRYGPHDAAVTVAVATTEGLARWSVHDRGAGIRPQDRARLFERFFVGRSDRRGTREGIGLGLPTTLAIAQAHGGTIEVDSEPGSGSTFTLVVPVEGPEDAE